MIIVVDTEFEKSIKPISYKYQAKKPTIKRVNKTPHLPCERKVARKAIKNTAKKSSPIDIFK